MNKGLDTSFVHYGIRKEDLEILELLAEKHQLDWEWVLEYVLKPYHTDKTKHDTLNERHLIKLLEKALTKLEVE